MDLLHHLQILKMLLKRNDFGKLENLVNILGISKVFVKLLEIELYFDFM